MLIPIVVATRKTAISTIIEMSSLDMTRHPLCGSRCERRSHKLHGVPGPLPHPVADLLAA